MLVEIAQYIVINLSVAFILGLVLGYVIGKGNKEKFNSIQCSKNNDENTIKKNKFKINPIFNKSASLDFKPMVLSSSNKKVIGVLSDGDLRRALMKEGFSIDCNVESIATLNPRTFDDENLLASDALQIIETYKIQLLIITNKNRELKGLLHIHDLIEAGIK